MMSESPFFIQKRTTPVENTNRASLVKLLKETPIPDDELLFNLYLYTPRLSLTNTLFINDIYQKILPVHGSIFEFGVRWGKNLALFEALRGIYEPYNYNRKIIGFDTFQGFVDLDEKDGTSEEVKIGAYGVTAGYEEYLQKVLDCHEAECPISHIKKYGLIKGDASKTIHKYLDEHPETILALVYFDLDVYSPTRTCLEAILPHLTKGSVLAFDEINYPGFPGETIALDEVIGIKNCRICHSPYATNQGYIIME